MKAIIYARCSTDESKQDVEVQLKELRRYCEHHGWEYDEVFEYGSGYKGDQPKLKDYIEQIKKGFYGAMLVWSMVRFSREHPRKVDDLLNRIAYDYKCRFISLTDGIDSADEVKWHIMRHLMTYFANVYSRKLSERVKNGIKRAKEKKTYNGGRPKKKIASERLMDMKEKVLDRGLSIRRAAEEYNDGLPRDQRIGKSKMAELLSCDKLT